MFKSLEAEGLAWVASDGDGLSMMEKKCDDVEEEKGRGRMGERKGFNKFRSVS